MNERKRTRELAAQVLNCSKVRDAGSAMFEILAAKPHEAYKSVVYEDQDRGSGMFASTTGWTVGTIEHEGVTYAYRTLHRQSNGCYTEFYKAIK